MPQRSKIALVLPVVFAFACAKGDTQSQKHDMALNGGDLAGADLAGTVDQATPNEDAGGIPDLMPPEDLATNGVCNVIKQTGCTNQKCAYSDPGAGTVTPFCTDEGTQLTGETCNTSSAADCIGANICIVEDDTAKVNMCRHWCQSDNDCPGLAPVGAGDLRAWCEFPLTGYPAKLCTVPCNPLAALGDDGCVDGLGCRYFTVTRGATESEAVDCGQIGVKALDAACASTSECAAGLLCIAVNAGASTCRQICRHRVNGMDMMPADCPASTHCSAVGNVVDPVFGACVPD